MIRGNLETELRQLLRAEIRRSPVILKEYRRRHRWDWARWLAMGVSLPLLAAVGIVIMPLVFTAPLQVPLLVHLVELGETPLARMHWDPGMLLGGQAMMIAAIGSLTLVNGWACFCQQKDLMAVTFWPVSDRELNRRSLVNWLGGLAYLAYMLGLLTIGVALVAHPTPLQFAALIVSISLNAWHLMALAILWCSATRTSRELNQYWTAPAGTCYALVWLAGVFPIFPWSQTSGVSDLLIMVPTGWVNGTVTHLFFEPHPLALGYIVALVATWIYAANWLRQGFRIREVLIGADGKVTPVFESGLPSPPEAVRQLTGQVSEEGASDELVARLLRARAPRTPEQLQNEAACLLWRSWNRCGWMERIIIRLMTKREKALVEHFHHGHPHWGLLWAIGAVFTLAGVAAVAIGFWVATSWGYQPPGTETVIAPFLMLWLLMVLWLEIMLPQIRGGQMRKRIHAYGGTHPVYPVGWKDVLGIIRKTIWIRLTFQLPLALAVASLDWLFAPNLVVVSYVLACKGIVLVGLALEAFGWMPFFATAMSSPYNWRRFLGLVLFACLATLWIFAAMLTMIPMVFVAAPALVVLLLCTAGLRQCAKLVYHHLLDFPCRETMLPRGK